MEPFVHDPDNPKHTIDSIYAFISEDENGEGVCAASNGTALIMPLIAADERRLELLKPIAQELARHTKKKIKLVKFSVREDLETIGDNDEG